MPEEIRIGIIGGGGIFKNRHIPGLQKLKDVKITGICNRSRKSSETFAQEYNVDHIYDSPEDIINSEENNAIMIGTWPYMHCSLTHKALLAKKHVFTQARMARDLKEAKIMLEESKQFPELVCQICPSPFGMNVDPYIQKLISDGFIGKQRHVRFSALNADINTPFNWRQQKEFSGLNILGMGIFYESFCRWTGPAQDVYAIINTHIPQRKDEVSGDMKSVDIGDEVLISANMKNGGSGSIHLSGAVAHGQDTIVDIYGSQGTIIYNFSKDELRIGKINEELKTVKAPKELTGHWAVEEDFINAIRGENVGPTSFEEGTHYMAFTQAVADSAASNQMVTISN